MNTVVYCCRAYLLYLLVANTIADIRGHVYAHDIDARTYTKNFTQLARSLWVRQCSFYKLHIKLFETHHTYYFTYMGHSSRYESWTRLDFINHDRTKRSTFRTSDKNNQHSSPSGEQWHSRQWVNLTEVDSTTLRQESFWNPLLGD